MKIAIHPVEIPPNGRPHPPAEDVLIDNFGRRITYLRLSVTDRCNLRCVYCMPEQGVPFLSREQILSFEEMERILRLLAGMGVNKVRITGGEPFVRKGLMDFLRRVHAIEGVQAIHITTNGVLTAPHVPELKRLGVKSINLSIDTLDRERFFQMTRRDELERVLACFHTILAHDIPLKINMVLMEGQNAEDIIPMSRLSRDYPVEVRYIEEMPFNGADGGRRKLFWNHKRILETLRNEYPGLYPLESEANSTSMNFRVPGHKGDLGIIAGFSRTFCGSCNRIRVTARGTLQTCLYGEGVLDLKSLLRGGATDEEIKNMFRQCTGQRFKDGWEAEKQRSQPLDVSQSMALIGG